MWTIKPPAYNQTLAMGPWSGIGFCLLSMALTSVGCLRRKLLGLVKLWGWLLALAIFAINGIADAARLLAGEVLEGLIWVIAAGAIVYVLSRPKIRRAFEK